MSAMYQASPLPGVIVWTVSRWFGIDDAFTMMMVATIGLTVGMTLGCACVEGGS